MNAHDMRRVFPIREEYEPMTDEENAHAQRQADAAYAELREKVPDLSKRLKAIATSREPVRVNLRALNSLAERVSKITTPYAACKSGCSHCCHMAVAVSEPEAAMIGQAIGRKPAKPKKWMFTGEDRDEVDIGSSNPCTFLVGGQCGIYENRPLACRIHFHMGPNADPCNLDAPRLTANFNLTMFDQVYAVAGRSNHLADIRDYFPPKMTR